MKKTIPFFDRASLDKFLIYHENEVLEIEEKGDIFLVKIDLQDKAQDNHLVSLLGSNVYKRKK